MVMGGVGNSLNFHMILYLNLSETPSLVGMLISYTQIAQMFSQRAVKIPVNRLVFFLVSFSRNSV